MFEIGDNVLVFLVSGYWPAAFIGRVEKIYGLEGAELSDAVLCEWCDGGRWGDAADGSAAVRNSMQEHLRYHGVVRFAGCRSARPWVGAIPAVAPRAGVPVQHRAGAR